MIKIFKNKIKDSCDAGAILEAKGYQRHTIQSDLESSLLWKYLRKKHRGAWVLNAYHKKGNQYAFFQNWLENNTKIKVIILNINFK
jgi:hypothetical protein